MSKVSQTASGKAFEYQLALTIADSLEVKFCDSQFKSTAREAYDRQSASERDSLILGARTACSFLRSHDARFERASSVALQPDAKGQLGDVRDIIVGLGDGETTGISVKNRHQAIKHSRLSDRIDFGHKWTDFRCSNEYWQRIGPIFADLRHKRGHSFKSVQDKEIRYYLPVLSAFEDEFKRLYERHGQTFVERVFRYLTGQHDHYQVINQQQQVVVQSFNIGGSLRWGRKWRVPAQIDTIRMESTSTTTVTFKGGWLISFRIHNAASRIEPSLKFDIQLLACPREVARESCPFVQ